MGHDSHLHRKLHSHLPEVSPKLTNKFLCHFTNVQSVMAASEEALMQVDSIGKEKAKKIREMLAFTE
ncbi:hypothetical protein HT094_17980 [Shewanella sp. ZOR0012]|uniref:helix-hairpin-helix domain-containing protein n=1 Tax=Shewanella sp. ZOR0012 TaxID=1339231 RepID=UPI0012E0A779|nr:helix-hairpin-helix domain-containing protein [Shewanella sp. ZOR0012]NSM26051.1 hypothetical protein [Shewanella sp. ZOR0012]